MSATTAYKGRGSKLSLSIDGLTFLQIAQLQGFEFGGIKTTILDRTNSQSPANTVEKLATLLDSGDLSFGGVLNNQSTTQPILYQSLQTLTLLSWKILLPDQTAITFAGYVDEYVPAKVDYSKAITFSGKISISGPVTIVPGLGTINAGGFQVPGFQSPGFQSSTG